MFAVLTNFVDVDNFSLQIPIDVSYSWLHSTESKKSSWGQYKMFNNRQIDVCWGLKNILYVMPVNLGIDLLMMWYQYNTTKRKKKHTKYFYKPNYGLGS